jgi:hypothetical protein
MKRKSEISAAKPRNLLHDHPLLRKGGTHDKPKKAGRRKDKVALKREWYPQSVFVESALPAPFTA